MGISPPSNFLLELAMIILSFFVIHCLCTKLGVDVNKDGSYNLVLNDKPLLKSAATGFRTNKQWYSSDKTIGGERKGLNLMNFQSSQGKDEFGQYTLTELTWKTEDGESSLKTSFKDYVDIPAIVFTTIFPEGVNNASLYDNEDVISAFPSFDTESTSKSLNYLTFKSTFCPVQMGHWNDFDLYHGGHLYGPLVLYDENLESIIVSPISNFMIGYQIRDSKSILKNFAAGISGMTNILPQGFSHSVLIYGETGMNKLFREYGNFNMQYFKKRRIKYSDDVFIQKINYYTDNGAYYYYITEEGKNYEDTMIDAGKFMMNNQSIPLAGIQYDSWWYTKGSDGGLFLWEPREDIFPNGMKYVDDILKLPATLHNRWFSKDNAYLKLNFSMYADPKSGISLPQNKDLFTYIMKKAKSWGMTCYEQDWLSKTYTNMDILQSDVSFGKNWFDNMFSAAKDLDLTVQLCMAYPIHMLQTLESSTDVIVTHSRASDDYQPRRKQWPLAYTSMFYYSGLGIIPFKDNFWTTDKTQPGCKYSNCEEPNPILQTIVSVISGGPVSPSDKIGFLDEELIFETCRIPDGVILKPDRPALPLDILFSQGFHDPFLLKKEVWDTFNCYEGVGCWYYIFSADLLLDFTLNMSMLPFDGFGDFKEYYAIQYTPKEETISNIVVFDIDHPLKFKRSEFHPISQKIHHELWTLAPKMDTCKWMFLKEMKKIISAAKERIVSFMCDEGKLEMKINAVDGEKVKLAVLQKQYEKIVYVSCNGPSTLTCVDECVCQ